MWYRQQRKVWWWSYFTVGWKIWKKLIKSSLYQKRSTVRGQSFFSISSGGPWSSYPHKKCQIDFLENWKMSFCFGSYFWKIILIKTWNLLMSLIRRRDMTEHFLVFVSICLSPYAFPGMEYQETYVGFTFLTILRLGKKLFYISELFSVNA